MSFDTFKIADERARDNDADRAASWNLSTAQTTDSTKVVVRDFMFTPTISTVKQDPP